MRGVPIEFKEPVSSIYRQGFRCHAAPSEGQEASEDEEGNFLSGDPPIPLMLIDNV